jgi:excinuclease ABC subunit C
LNVFLKVLQELGHPKIPLVAMAKARIASPDRFFLPGRKDAMRLPERGAAYRMLQRIRDEAHRFAVKYHRHLRSRVATSVFEEIPGIGPRKAKILLKHTAGLPDLSQIMEADLEGCKGLSRSDIENILSFFRGHKEKGE